MVQAVPIAWAGKAIVLNIMHCEGAPLTSLPPGVTSALTVAPEPNHFQEGCAYFMASLAPGQPTLWWDRSIYFAQRCVRASAKQYAVGRAFCVDFQVIALYARFTIATLFTLLCMHLQVAVESRPALDCTGQPGLVHPGLPAGQHRRVEAALRSGQDLDCVRIRSYSIL